MSFFNPAMSCQSFGIDVANLGIIFHNAEWSSEKSFVQSILKVDHSCGASYHLATLKNAWE